MKLMAAAALLAVGLGGNVNAAPLSVDLAPASGEIQESTIAPVVDFDWNSTL